MYFCNQKIDKSMNIIGINCVKCVDFPKYSEWFHVSLQSIKVITLMYYFWDSEPARNMRYIPYWFYQVVLYGHESWTIRAEEICRRWSPSRGIVVNPHGLTSCPSWFKATYGTHTGFYSNIKKKHKARTYFQAFSIYEGTA